MLIADAPYWLLALLTAALPVARAAAFARGRRRAIAGLCTACGYDLRASPERCPECGAIAEKGDP
jgi:rubrerythrin